MIFRMLEKVLKAEIAVCVLIHFFNYSFTVFPINFAINFQESFCIVVRAKAIKKGAQ